MSRLVVVVSRLAVIAVVAFIAGMALWRHGVVDGRGGGHGRPAAPAESPGPVHGGVADEIAESFPVDLPVGDPASGVVIRLRCRRSDARELPPTAIIVRPMAAAPLAAAPGDAAIIEAPRLPRNLPAWAVDCVTRQMCKVAARRLPDAGRLAVVSGADGVRYLEEHAVLFDGAVILPPFQPEMAALRLENLANFPIAFVFPPEAAGARAAAAFFRQLASLPRDAAMPPLRIFRQAVLSDGGSAAAMTDDAINWLASRCVLSPTPHRELFWRGDGLPPAPLGRWLEITALSQYNAEASLQAVIADDGRGGTAIRIKCRNVGGFAVYGEVLSSLLHGPVSIEINGVAAGAIANGVDWPLQFRDHGGTEGWSVDDGLAASGATKTFGNCGPIARALQAPCIAAYGTQLADTARQWEQCARDFAAAWREQNGVGIAVLADRECLPESMEGKNVILFGSPEENSLSAFLLRESPAFLRQIFAILPERLRGQPELCAITMAPSDEINAGAAVVLVLADHESAIAAAWQALTAPACQNADYIFYLTGQRRTAIAGSYSHDWRR